jgi:hypothetical protein
MKSGVRKENSTQGGKEGTNTSFLTWENLVMGGGGGGGFQPQFWILPYL